MEVLSPLRALRSLKSRLKKSLSPKSHALDFDPNTLPWFDRPGADIERYLAGLRNLPRDYDLAESLRHFHQHGFVVFRNAVSHELVDAYLADLEELISRSRDFSTVIGHEHHGHKPIKELDPEALRSPRLRICDFHNSSLAGKKLMLNPKVTSFLGHVFGDQVVAMQSLTFLRGSEQTTHQDFPYVVSEIPSHLAACWIALEDIHPDSGPLSYFPGSHRLPKFDFGNGMFLTPESKYNELDFARFLEQECAKRGLQATTFAPKKGDMFIWHGCLAHGGSKVNQPELTRKSFVAHFSSRRAYTRDRRNPHVEPRIHALNGGLVYGHPNLPNEENAFRHGEPISG